MSEASPDNSWVVLSPHFRAERHGRSIGEGIPDAVVAIEAVGDVTVDRAALGATKRNNSTPVVLGATGNQAPHIAVFLLSRVVPVFNRYEG